jgi:peroxiredoxin
MGEDPRPKISLEPISGWHCRHLYYRFDRARLRALSSAEVTDGCRQVAAVLDPQGPEAPARLQTMIVSGQKADFGLIALDADPRTVDRLHQRLMAGPLGTAVQPVWSFISMTEVSEYLPTAEQYAEKLRADGEDPAGEAFGTKLAQYARRQEIMRRQRLTPDMPAWPAVCFYPMNKKRSGDANWFLLDFAERDRLMNEHGGTGMQFSGKVTQLVTAGIGLDDWEWGVTLWARNPQFLKEIVYRMRFDEASARYAEFGPFYAGYVSTAEAILEHCLVAKPG